MGSRADVPWRRIATALLLAGQVLVSSSARGADAAPAAAGEDSRGGPLDRGTSLGLRIGNGAVLGGLLPLHSVAAGIEVWRGAVGVGLAMGGGLSQVDGDELRTLVGEVSFKLGVVAGDHVRVHYGPVLTVSRINLSGGFSPESLTVIVPAAELGLTLPLGPRAVLMLDLARVGWGLYMEPGKDSDGGLRAELVPSALIGYRF